MDYLWSPWRMQYIQNHQETTGCALCNEEQRPDGPENLIACRGQWSFVILNRFPYTSGHLMVVPFQHVPDLESLEAPARAEIMELVTQATQVLRVVYHPDGFNIGANIGAAAGAGIAEHFHMHIVPRWAGDANFMTTLGQTRILPETLEDTYHRLKASWPQV